jgi:Icc protein
VKSNTQLKVAWVTDPHLNFASENGWNSLITGILESSPSAVIMTGDISEGPYVTDHINRLVRAVGLPVYFVLGNHDFYHRRRDDVITDIRSLCSSERNAVWLSDVPSVNPVPGLALVGADGWYDASYGWSSDLSIVFSWDWKMIRDFSNRTRLESMIVSRAWSKQSATHLEKELCSLDRSIDRVAILTHVPPWPELTDDTPGTALGNFWLPYNVSAAAGDAISRAADWASHRSHSVFCGHTHVARSAWISSNVYGRCGKAQYGKPRVQDVILL